MCLAARSESTAADGKRKDGDVGKCGGSDGGGTDRVRLIVAWRGQPLSSANIIIRFSIRLQPSDVECKTDFSLCLSAAGPRSCARCKMFFFYPSLFSFYFFFAIQSGCKAAKRLHFIGWIPKQITRPLQMEDAGPVVGSGEGRNSKTRARCGDYAAISRPRRAVVPCVHHVQGHSGVLSAVFFIIKF